MADRPSMQTTPTDFAPDAPAVPWKKGRGKLGAFKPLLGAWHSISETPMGPMSVTRTFEPMLDGAYIQLTAVWDTTSLRDDDAGNTEKSAEKKPKKHGKAKKPYTETCLFGVNRDKTVCFWSFTNDGKQQHGEAATAEDLPEGALVFEAEMPHGRARQAYFPHPDGGVRWVVENLTKKGWNRLVDHRYVPVPDAA